MGRVLDLNSDMGESFGNWRMGNDPEVMRLITTANVACGFHGGDPLVMQRTVQLARENGVRVGAHPGLPDLLGFGRRRMMISQEDAYTYTLYQIGALQGFLGAAGLKLSHVKPHGAFYAMCATDPDVAGAVVRAVLDYDPSLPFYFPAPLSSALPVVARRHGLRVVGELYVDMDYAGDGRLVVSRQVQHKDPKECAERVLRWLETDRVPTVEGGWIEVEAESVCIHGDGPQAVEILQVLRSELGLAGVQVGQV